jgi:septal ring factor EnvC (AmiA/AmiB activator)
MMSFLIGFNIFLAIALLLGVAMMLKATIEMRKVIAAMDKRVAQLDERIGAQQAQLNELRQTLARQPDVMQTVVSHLGGMRSNGPLKTLVALGSSLFAAYLRQKRTKALPSRVESKD